MGYLDLARASARHGTHRGLTMFTLAPLRPNLAQGARRGIYRSKPIATPHCPACQLQLCKGQDEPPHAALKTTDTGAPGDKFSGRETAYVCQTSAATMVRSADRMQPGWRQRR